MSEEEFAKLNIVEKWQHVAATVDYIMSMDKLVEHKNMFRSMGFDKKTQIRNLRVDQYQRWSHIKNLYAAHRDEMSDTLGSDKFAECKNVIEGVFTMEVDDALRDVLEE